MKCKFTALCCALSLVSVAAGQSAKELALIRARQYGALAKEVLRIVDQDGVPVAGASVWGGLQTGYGYKDFIPIKGNTDTNGEFVVQGKCTNRITCRITKDGYYDSEYLLTDYGSNHTLEDGKWCPYGEETKVLLKKIKNPIALRHANPNLAPPPTQGEWCAYDIEHRQWVTEGSGLHPDMLVRIASDIKDEISDFKVVMDVSFTNNPYAGAYVMQKDKCSDMKSEYHADTNAAYQTNFSFIYERHRNIVEKHFKYVSGMKEIDTRLGEDSYLVFRTRTEVDANGDLRSAHYGKIYGVWEFFRGMRAANVQFNPNPNDTNLEDEETSERTLMRKRQREAPPYKKKRKKFWPFR